jgi:hypothetical protein
MIEMKQAVQIAKENAMGMLGQASVNLEEIERDSYKGRDVWSITISLPPHSNTVNVFSGLSVEPLRYKRFLIDVETGEMVAMKLREVTSQ